MFTPINWNEVDYMPERTTDMTMWDVPWELESPSQGGRILAKDARSTIVYEPICSPYSESEQRLARLFLKSREMFAMLDRVAPILSGNGYRSVAAEINDIILEVEGK